jgi:cytochrome P450
LIGSAINEVLRLEAPIQGFSRYVKRDVDVDGVLLPAHSRVIVFYGSANRDERKYEHAERFDLTRKAADHLSFGHGDHICVGMHLARIEMEALLQALVKRVKRFEITASEREINNVLRGFKSLEVVVHT